MAPFLPFLRVSKREQQIVRLCALAYNILCDSRRGAVRLLELIESAAEKDP